MLSGEVIVFQNEVQEIFKKLINLSEVPLEADDADQLLSNVDAYLLEKSQF